jgi:hypothetical protein
MVYQKLRFGSGGSRPHVQGRLLSTQRIRFGGMRCQEERILCTALCPPSRSAGGFNALCQLLILVFSWSRFLTAPTIWFPRPLLGDRCTQVSSSEPKMAALPLGSVTVLHMNTRQDGKRYHISKACLKEAAWHLIYV